MQIVLRLMSPAMVAVVLLTGCARHPSPERALEDLRMQAEERLLQDARASFFQGKYQETVLLLDRFLANHPGSRLIDEARWWLARAQQQNGNLHDALMRYRQLAGSRHRNPYRDEAQLRMAELESILGVHHDTQEVVGVMVGAQSLVQPNGLDVAARFRDRLSAKVVAIDLPCRMSLAGETTGESSRPEAMMWDLILHDGIKPLVTAGREQGFEVVVGVPLRCLGSYHQASDEEVRRWRDRTYDVTNRRMELSDAYSLFSAEYREVVFALLSQAAELRVAGLIFRATASPGPYEGFTLQALRGFEQQFDERLTPELLFDPRSGGGTVLSSHMVNQQASASMDFPPIYWKWAGWKAREGIRFMNELAAHLRSRYPYLMIGVEVHAESIDDPVFALVNVGEDWVEMSHGEFDVMVTGPHESAGVPVRSGTSRLPEAGSGDKTVALVRRMVDYLGNAERVWVIQSKGRSLPFHDGDGPFNTAFPKGVGILYDYTSIP